MDRGNVLQIYHLNLLKPRTEAVPVARVMVVPERFTSAHCEDHLSPSQRAQVARLQEEYSDVFLS